MLLLCGQKSGSDCNIKHPLPFVLCSTDIVCSLLLSGDAVYVGQPGRCINVRLMEHVKCNPLFEYRCVLWQHNDQLTRQVVETFHIKRNKGTHVSHVSVTLHENEVVFLLKAIA